MMNLPFKISESLPYILLPFLCLFFDESLKISWIKSNYILRAVVDNTGHGSIAFLSWLAVSGVNKRGFAESVICGVMACAIDLDHFIMAKSYSLEDALSLPNRPPFHSTSILIPILPVTGIVFLYYPPLRSLPYLTMVSVLSHHVRDGYRRGIWFWPVGSTPPIPHWLYLVIIILLPLTTSLVMKQFENKLDFPSDV